MGKKYFSLDLTPIDIRIGNEGWWFTVGRVIVNDGFAGSLVEVAVVDNELVISLFYSIIVRRWVGGP